MPRTSAKLFKNETGLWHWCPGCNAVHCMPRQGWKYSTTAGPDAMTATPSFKHTKPHGICHYSITGGLLAFHADSTHALKGRTIELPEFPPPLGEDWGL